MSKSVESPRILAARAGIAFGLMLGLNVIAVETNGQEATTPPRAESEQLLAPKAGGAERPRPTPAVERTRKTAPLEKTPSFEELDSAASDLNEALSGARAKLDELRQATELAAMAAELREELEASIQENNRLAASLAEVQGERSELETRQNGAERQIAELTQTVEASKLEIERQTKELEARQSEIERVEDARASAERQVRDLEGQLNDAGDEVTEVRAEIEEMSGQLEATQTELTDANSRAAEARDARDGADRELTKVRKQIAGMLRSVLLGGEPIDVSALQEDEQATDAAADIGLGVRYEALRASNVRAAPSPDAERVGYAKRGDYVTVIGKVNGRNWFEIETIEGVRGFIFGDLIRPAA